MRHWRLPFCALLLFGLCGNGCKQGTRLPVGVMTEVASFHNEVFYFDGDMNLVYEMRIGDFHRGPGPEILVVSDDGYRLLNRQGKLLRRVPFKFNRRWSSRAIWGGRSLDLDGDGTLEFAGVLTKDPRTAIFDAAGKLVRQVPSTTYADLLVVDTDGDGQEELVVNEWQRLALFGRNQTHDRILYEGKALNVQPLGHDDKNRPLIGFDTPGEPWEMVTINGNGAQVYRWPVRWDSFSFSPLPGPDGRASQLIFTDTNHLVITDLTGRVTRRLEAPFARVFAHFHAAQVPGPQTGAYVLAVGAGTGKNHIHMVYLFEPGGSIVYQWRGWDNGGPLLVVDAKPGRYPTFLVGGRNEIRLFRPAES